MEIKNGMIVKVVNVILHGSHKHLNDIGMVTEYNKRKKTFFIRFENEATGVWLPENVVIIDLNKEYRINKRLAEIERLKKEIKEIEKEKE